MFNSLGTVKTKTYAPPKGGVGANNVELSEESDADLIGQHDTTEDEGIVLTEVSDNELPDETVVLRSILPDDASSISGINTIPPLSNGPRRSLRLSIYLRVCIPPQLGIYHFHLL